MVEWPPDWIWRMFNRETAYVNDFIEPVIDVWKETLGIIENNSADGGQDDTLLTEEISKFIDISENLLKKRNHTLAYFFTLIAERRILIHLIKNKEYFPSIIESRRLDYISDAKKLEREGKLEEEEIENLKEINGKRSLGKADWFILSVFIVRARSEMVADQIQRATEADRLLRKLAFFRHLLLFSYYLSIYSHYSD